MSEFNHIDELILKQLNDTIQPEEFEQLQQQLQDPKAVQHYVKTLILNSLLTEEVTSTLSNDKSLSANLLNEAIEKDIKESQKKQTQIIKQQAQLQLQDFLSKQQLPDEDKPVTHINYKQSESTFSLQRSVKVLKTLAACLLVAAAIWLYIQPKPQPIIANVLSTENAEWVAASTRTTLTPDITQGDYQLTKGLVEIQFLEGAKVILQAPCQFGLDGSYGIDLDQGQLSVKLDTGKKDFSVNTPSALIVDFGTEFSVSVDSSGISQVHVFDGQVGLKPTSQSKSDNSEFVLMNKGDAKEVSADGLTVNTISIENEKFVRAMPGSLPKPTNTTSKTSYAQMVKSKNPLIYYTFEPSQATDYQTFGNTAIIESSLSLNNQTNHTLKLDGNNSFIKCKKLKPHWEKNGYTFSFWLYAKPPQNAHRSIVVNTPNPIEAKYHDVIKLAGINHEKNIFSFYHKIQLKNESPFLYPIESNRPVVFNQWMHITLAIKVQQQKITGQFFLNGTLLGKIDSDDATVTLFNQDSDIYIGAPITYREPDGETITLKSLDGQIDEFAIFDYPLSQKDVIELFQSSQHNIN